MADTLNAYLWRHFHPRPQAGTTLFNKEYLTLADLWLANASPKNDGRSVQDSHRDNLLAMQIGDDGYVYTHQHFSHAHDLGWPFPLWTQAAFNKHDVRGITAGWHFQEEEGLRGWVANFLRGDPKMKPWYGPDAVAAWHMEGGESPGIVGQAWEILAADGDVTLNSPKDAPLNAFNVPYLQMRWTWDSAPQHHAIPYIEWQREKDTEWSESRRVYCYPEKTPLSQEYFHSISTMHTHPEWQGQIKQLRVVLPGGGRTYQIDSIFTVYDTRHTINNPIYILSSYNYFVWTGDLPFLKEQMPRLRFALRYMQTELGGLELNRIRNPWPGHAGRAGWIKQDDGVKLMRPGRGVGNNYWDLMPFGWDDFYSTMQYYAALLRMAELEAAIAEHPGWNIPGGPLALDAEELRHHAEHVKATANELFWNEETGRYFASIDIDGNAYDYGYTFLNLEAIWYDIVPEDRAETIMAWIDGKRIVERDTSQGDDIYHWRFAPRATTKRNVEWYGQGWSAPESIPWGGQVQDGGAVLGFTFYDLWARLKVLGPENAWERLNEIAEWDREVQATGGYRAYYADGSHGTTLQGCGTPGGLGIDCEFYESSLMPAILVYGFLGIDPKPGKPLSVAPRLPTATEGLSLHGLQFRGDTFTVEVNREQTGEKTLNQSTRIISDGGERVE